jgi:membrane-bound lytic murein transglycosylase B
MQRLAAATHQLEAPNFAVLDARLVAAYATLRDPKRPAASRAAAARTIQLATSQLLSNTSWRPVALAALKPADRASVQAILDAGDELTVLGDEVNGTPQWRISAPDPAPALLEDYHEGEGAYGIPWQYLAAINFVETAMGRIHGLSVAGAQGPMQFMPATWAAFGRGDVNSPHDAVLAAARYLHARGGPASMDAALYSYNNSHSYVRAIDIFARQVATDPDAYTLYYNWQVIVPTREGPAVIPEGWAS